MSEPTIKVQGRRIVYSMDAEVAEELANVLDRYVNDAGWIRDAKALRDAIDEVESPR